MLIKEHFTLIEGSGTTLTNNEMKHIMKVIKFLEIVIKFFRILLKRTSRKISSQEGGFLNFLMLLTIAGLPLRKSVLTLLA